MTTTPVLTISFTEDEMKAATENARKHLLYSVFYIPADSDRGGPGFRLLSKKVEEWCEAFDFDPMIEEISAEIIEPVMRKAIAKAITARVGTILSRMIANGELDVQIAAIVKQKIVDDKNATLVE